MAQLVDPSLAQGLAKGSSRAVDWQCPLGHRWTAKVYNRTSAKNQTGCPVCSGKKVLPGFNDVATTHPAVAELIIDLELRRSLTAHSNRRVDLRCGAGHQWQAPLARVTSQNARCPQCTRGSRRSAPAVRSGLLADAHPELAAQLVDPSLALTLKPGSGKKVEWVCELGHVWTSTPNNRTATIASRGKAQGCPYCTGRKVLPGFNDLATEMPELAAQLLDPQPDGVSGVELARSLRPRSNKTVSWVCHRHAEPVVWSAAVNNRAAGTGCPVCSERAVVTGLNDLRTTHPQLAGQLLDPQPDGTPAALLAQELSRGSHRRLHWACDAGHTWPAIVKDRTRGTDCSDCACSRTSELETLLVSSLCVLSDDVVPQAPLGEPTGRPGGSPTVDALLPNARIAVEFNGLYWHSEKFVDKDRHRAKTELASSLGLHLIHVWEDEWLDRPGIVLRALAHRIGALDHLENTFDSLDMPWDPAVVEKLNARSLALAEVDGRTARAFLDANHVQGAVTLTRSFGLLDTQGRLRALLGLRSPRNNARMKRGPGQWEVQRYATLGSVRGGFTRLLAFAERTLVAEGTELSEWISFSDDGLSDGGMYSAAGFTAQGSIAPDYRYTGGVVGRRRSPKESFQLKRFRTDESLVYEEGWTERQAAAANGLHRVYDSGKTRWVKSVA